MARVDGLIGIDPPPVFISTLEWGAFVAAGAPGEQGIQGSQGVQGIEGPMGSQGPQGIQGIQGPQGSEGPMGLQGLQGDPGPQGQQGIQGVPGESGASGITVRGNYSPFEVYYINDYVVSAEGNGFVTRVDGLIGIDPPPVFISTLEWAAFVAAGAPGEQGIQGPQGVQGIEGAVGPEGPIGPQGLQGPEGSMGIQGPEGPQGPQGSQGIQGPEGIQGPPGPTGLPGSAMSVMTFASGTGVPLVGANASGTSVTVYAARDGSHSDQMTLTGGSTFSFSTGYAYSFVMPYDAVVDSIYMTATNLSFTNYAANAYPYVALAVAEPNSNVFTILPETRTIVETPYTASTAYPANTILNGSLVGIGTLITAGTRVAVVCAVQTTGTSPAQSYYLYFTGGILLI